MVSDRRMREAGPRMLIDESFKRSGVVRLLPYWNSGEHYDPRWPKESAVCELNLEKWRRLINLHKVGGDAEVVLDGCKNGFHQVIPDHSLGNRRWFTPPNHESATNSAEKIGNTLAKEKRENRIFGPLTHMEVFLKLGFFGSSPMGSDFNRDEPSWIIEDL